MEILIYQVLLPSPKSVCILLAPIIFSSFFTHSGKTFETEYQIHDQHSKSMHIYSLTVININNYSLFSHFLIFKIIRNSF